MTCNLGGIERSIRIVVGLMLLAVSYGAELPMAASVAAIVVGAVALVTGLIGYCPAWALFGINTCAAKKI